MITHDQECYLFIAGERVYKTQGGWPDKLATYLCKQYDKVVCVSLYSNTVKFLKNDLIETCDGEELYAMSYKEVRFDKDYYELT